jgi:hypothetical protein
MNIGREIEVNGIVTNFKGIIESDNGDFTYNIRITESNSERIKVGSVIGVMEESISKFI